MRNALTEQRAVLLVIQVQIVQVAIHAGIHVVVGPIGVEIRRRPVAWCFDRSLCTVLTAWLIQSVPRLPELVHAVDGGQVVRGLAVGQTRSHRIATLEIICLSVIRRGTVIEWSCKHFYDEFWRRELASG